MAVARQSIEQASAAGPVAAVVPPELKAKGWKLERRIINDDQEHPRFLLHNEQLDLHTQSCKKLECATDQARRLERVAARSKRSSRLKRLLRRRKKQPAKGYGR